MRIDGSALIPKTAMPFELKNNLTKGDVFQGEISDISKDSVTIRLANGQTVDAKMAAAMELTIGQKLLFEIKEINSEQLLLKALMGDTLSPKENKLNQILIQAGVPINGETIELVSKLLSEGQAVDKQSVSNLYKSIKQNPELKLPDFVALIKNQVPLTDSNIKSFLSVKNGSINLPDQLKQLINNGTEGAPYALKATIVDQLVKQYPQMASIQIDMDELLESLSSIQKKQINSDEVVKALTSTFNEESSKVAISSQKDNQIAQTLLGMSVDVQKNEATKGSNALINDGDARLINHQEPNLEKTFIPKQGLEIELSSTSDTNETQDVDIDTAMPVTKSFLLSKDESEALLKALNLTDKDLTKEIIDTIKDKITTKLLEKFVSIDRMDLLEPDLKEKVSEVLKNVVKLIETLSEHSDSKTTQEQSKDLNRQVQMTNELNKNLQMVQIPLNYQGQWIHNELYVLADKKKLKHKSPNDPVTALLRLDLANMGQMDIYATKTGKQVDVKFHVEDEAKKKIILQNMGQLAKGLNGRGYSLSNYSVTDGPKAFDFTNEVLEKINTHPQEMKRYSFDMRV